MTRFRKPTAPILTPVYRPVVQVKQTTWATPSWVMWFWGAAAVAVIGCMLLIPVAKDATKWCEYKKEHFVTDSGWACDRARGERDAVAVGVGLAVAVCL